MTNLFPPSLRPLSVFLVDDSALVREKLVELLASLPHVEIIGEAQNVPQAITAIAAGRPDVVILDLSMPGGSGLDVLRAVKATAPATVVIIMTIHPYRELGAHSLEAGADFYFEKGTEFERLAAVLAVLGRFGQPGASTPATPVELRDQPADALDDGKHAAGGSNFGPGRNCSGTSWVAAGTASIFRIWKMVVTPMLKVYLFESRTKRKHAGVL